MSRIFAALLLLGCLTLSAEDFGPVSIEVAPPMLPSTLGGDSYHTYEFRVANKSTKPVEILFSLNIQLQNRFEITRSVLVPPGASGTVSLYHPASEGYTQDVSLDIYIDRVRQKHSLSKMLYSHSYGPTITALVSPSLKMEDYQRLRLISHTALPTPISLLQWGQHLRDYIGLRQIYLSASDRLHPQAEAAIVQWVRLGGTLIMLVEPDAPWPDNIPGADKGFHRESLDWGTIVYCRPVNPTQKEAVAKFLKDDEKQNPKLNIWTQPAASKEMPELGAPAESLRSYLKSSSNHPLYDGSMNLLPNLTEIPLRLLFVVMLVFVLLIGPLNFWYLRRKKKEPWILVTTPVISLIFCAVVILFITFSEGWYSRGRAVAITLLDQTAQQSVTRAWMAVYAPISPRGGFNFRAGDCLEFGHMGSPKLNLNESQHYISGLLIPRVPLDYELKRVETRRERLQVQSVENGQLRLVNGLGGSLQSLAVVGHDSRIYRSQGVIGAGAAIALPDSGRKSDTWVFSGPALKRHFSALPDEVDIMALAAALPPGWYVALADAPLFFSPGITPQQFQAQQYIIGKYDSSGENNHAN